MASRDIFPAADLDAASTAPQRDEIDTPRNRGDLLLSDLGPATGHSLDGASQDETHRRSESSGGMQLRRIQTNVSGTDSLSNYRSQGSGEIEISPAYDPEDAFVPSEVYNQRGEDVLRSSIGSWSFRSDGSSPYKKTLRNLEDSVANLQERLSQAEVDIAWLKMNSKEHQERKEI